MSKSHHPPTLYVATGSGPFMGTGQGGPEEMLRYDGCRLVSEYTGSGGETTVVLEYSHGRGPASERWASFGWRIDRMPIFDERFLDLVRSPETLTVFMEILLGLAKNPAIADGPRKLVSTAVDVIGILALDRQDALRTAGRVESKLRTVERWCLAREAHLVRSLSPQAKVELTLIRDITAIISASSKGEAR